MHHGAEDTFRGRTSGHLPAAGKSGAQTGCSNTSAAAISDKASEYGHRMLVNPLGTVAITFIFVTELQLISKSLKLGGGKNEVQDSRCRSADVHYGSDHPRRCCSPYCCWPPAARACAGYHLWLQFAVSRGNAAAVKAVVGPT
jgi:hypothetical protein